MNPRTIVALLSAAACAAQAQGEGAGTTAGTLAPVTVTAHPGVAGSAFDTPASVDVIDGSVLRDARLQVNLSEALGRVPGLVAQNRQNYAQDLQISIRGYGARSTFGVRGLRLYADGIPATGPDGQGQVSHFDLASAERIEVLRGPYSALYGNASGGVISIVTAEGGPDPVADISTAFGSDGVRRATLQASGQSGSLKLRLSGTRFETDGSRQHSAARRDSFNGKLNWDAGDGTRLTLVLNQLSMPDTQDPLGLTRTQWQADPRAASPAALAFDTRKSVDQLQAGLVLEHRLSRSHALQLTAYAGRRDTLQFQAIPVATQAAPAHPGGVIDLARSYDGIDARWIANGRTALGPWNVTAGLSAERTRDARRGWNNFIGATTGVQGALRRDEDNRALNLAPYVQGQWVLGERWSASAGVRHSRVSFRSQDHYLAPGNGDDSGSVRYAATTPAAGLVWHASDMLNVYGSVGRGFETPTLNEAAYQAGGAAGLNTTLRPAISRQWELGLKARPAPGWTATAALFGANTRDEIVVLTNTGGRATFQNAPGTKRRGIELSAQGRWKEGWSTVLSASWIAARYSQSFLTCTAAPCAVPSTTVDAGKRLPGVPRASLYGELAWSHPAWGFSTALEGRAIARVMVDDLNSDAAPGYATVSLRAGWQQQRGAWTLRQFVRVDNIADRRYAGSVIVNEGNQRFFEPAPGRQWLAGVSARYRF